MFVARATRGSAVLDKSVVIYWYFTYYYAFGWNAIWRRSCCQKRPVSVSNASRNDYYPLRMRCLWTVYIECTRIATGAVTGSHPRVDPPLKQARVGLDPRVGGVGEKWTVLNIRRRRQRRAGVSAGVGPIAAPHARACTVQCCVDGHRQGSASP